MAKIEKLKKDVEGVATTVYPVTIPQAVIDPTSGKSVRAELDEVDDNLAQLAGNVSVKMANLFTNGDFSNGSTGWDTSIPETTYAVANGILTATRMTDGNSVILIRKQAGETPPNSVLYTRYRVRVLHAGATSISINYGGAVNTIISSPNANQWYDAIDRYTSGGNAYLRSGVRAVYQTGQALTGYAIEVDYGIHINLTQMFGSGNEPTKEEMDLLISIMGVTYFEGEITIPAQKVMQWQLAMIRQNRNAIIALGGTII